MKTILPIITALDVKKTAKIYDLFHANDKIELLTRMKTLVTVIERKSFVIGSSVFRIWVK